MGEQGGIDRRFLANRGWPWALGIGIGVAGLRCGQDGVQLMARTAGAVAGNLQGTAESLRDQWERQA